MSDVEQFHKYLKAHGIKTKAASPREILWRINGIIRALRPQEREGGMWRTQLRRTPFYLVIAVLYLYRERTVIIASVHCMY